LAYLAGNLAAGEGYDWFYADNAARNAQTRSTISDGFGKPWIFRQKDLWNFWSQPHHERVGGVELASATAWIPKSKPIWLTEIGCPAVDKGANQPSVFPDPKSSEAGLPHFSNGKRDDLIQRRYLEAVLGTFDPAFGAAALNPVSPLYGGRMIAPNANFFLALGAPPFSPLSPASKKRGDAKNWGTRHCVTRRVWKGPRGPPILRITS